MLLMGEKQVERSGEQVKVGVSSENDTKVLM